MKWMRKHFIATGIIVSMVYAIIIHCLFSFHAPNDLLVAKWTAGEILTYASTVSLSLLALWQNKRFKDENDIVQARLEKLTEQANELSAISKIIEVENERLTRLKESLDSFTTACDSQTISRAYAQNSGDNLSVALAMVALEEDIDNSFFKACRELRLDTDVKKNDDVPVKKYAATFYLQAKNIVEILKATPTANVDKEMSVLSTVRNDFLGEREKYIGEQEKKLNRLTYGNMDLASIKEMYKREE